LRTFVGIVLILMSTLMKL